MLILATSATLLKNVKLAMCRTVPRLAKLVMVEYAIGEISCCRFHGGWVAPKIYAMGFASILNFGGLRIAGLSGIYKDKDYQKGVYEPRF